MRTWSGKRECYFCHLKEGDKYSWEVESIGDLPSDNWEKTIQSETRLVEVSRDFSKEDRVLFYSCSRCMLLLLLEESRTNYRYGFRIVEPEKEEKAETPKEMDKKERKEEEVGEEKEQEEEKVEKVEEA